MILEAVWGMEWDGFERMIDSHVKRIRSKLEKIRLSPNGSKQSGESVIDLRTTTTTSSFRIEFDFITSSPKARCPRAFLLL